MTVKLSAGGASLDDWRRILRGSGVTLDPAHRAGVAASAATVERILRRGEPVYGINTGFGHFADVVIPPEKLTELQYNIVRSHCSCVAHQAAKRILGTFSTYTHVYLSVAPNFPMNSVAVR